VRKTLRSPFDELRANGVGLESLAHCPFVLSPSTSSGQALSKHENPFFSTLLEEERAKVMK